MKIKEKIVDALGAALEIPQGYYQKAHDRYKDLGDWFCRENASTRPYRPRIYGQGSFRLGTVNPPLFKSDSFDLDVGCRLEMGLTKLTHTQEYLKTLVGDELEAYRIARQISQELQEKHRCWRLEYADELSFHMDVVPSIPEEMIKRATIAEAMVKHGIDRTLAAAVAQHSGNITDNRLPNYRSIDDDWRISNSEGYALWFESRMELASSLMQEIAAMAKQANVEKLPTWKWKTPLQKAVQILKRHRDRMFSKNTDSAPISIIITTLAAEAYQGEEDTASALDRILQDMDSYVQPSMPRVPNPVNPNEDFADKWYAPAYAHLNLEGNFRLWLQQARADFQNLEKLASEETIQKFTEEKFGIRIPHDDIAAILALLPQEPKAYQNVQVITGTQARPWCK